MEYSIKELSQLSGITSRTLRHYDSLQLLEPSRVSTNGYRHYNEHSVLQLQRILLLKRMGMPLDRIKVALLGATKYVEELNKHEHALLSERRAIDAMLKTIRQTQAALKEGKTMNAEEALHGFNEQYKDEVIERWGEDAYLTSNDWFENLTAVELQDFKGTVSSMNAEWVSVWTSGVHPDSVAAQSLARRHVEWLTSIPGTPAHGGTKRALTTYIEGLAAMYPADPRFAANYGGVKGAEFVRDALLEFVRN